MKGNSTAANKILDDIFDLNHRSNSSWVDTTLGALVDSLKAGVSVNSEDRAASVNEFGILKTSSVTYGKFLPEANKVVLPEEQSRCAVSPKKDCIIISRMNTQELVGANAYVAQDFPNLFLPDRLWQIEVRRDGTVCPLWLSFVLSSLKFRRMISDSASGTSGSMKNISKSSLLALPVCLPPPPEQRKIAEILSCWNEGVEKALKLQAARTKEKVALAKRFLEKAGDMISSEWEQRELGELATHKKGFAFKSEDFVKEGGRRVIRVSDTNANSIKDENPIFIPEHKAHEYMEYVLSAGDIILTTVGSRPPLYDSMVGKTVRVPIKTNGAFLNQNMVKLTPNANLIDSGFLFFILKTKRFIYHIEGSARGNANQASITLEDIFKFSVPLPPISQQRKIAEALSCCVQGIEILSAKINRFKLQKQALMQKLLTGKIRVKV